MGEIMKSSIQQNLFVDESTIKYKTVNIVTLKMVKEKSIKYDPVSNADLAINLIRSMYKNSYREFVTVIGLDLQNCPTVIHVVGTGSPNQSQVFIGNIFKPLLLSNSMAFIIVHNHPADSLIPSRADIEVTQRIKNVAELMEVNFLDHIIVNSDVSDHFSIRSSNDWPK
jgi:DNA repair protein RadC